MANYPKQIVPPFGKDDIKEIVQDGITNGDIVLPEVEPGTKLYKHQIQYRPSGTAGDNLTYFTLEATPLTKFDDWDSTKVLFYDPNGRVYSVSVSGAPGSQNLQVTRFAFGNDGTVSLSAKTYYRTDNWSDVVTEL